MAKLSEFTVGELKSLSPDDLVARGVVRTAPNHHDRRGYICPLCNSGGSGEYGSDGAGEFDNDGKFYCHACKNVDNGGHKLSQLDLYAIARNMQGEPFGVVARAMADEFGISVVEDDFKLSSPRRRHKTPPPKPKKEKIPVAELELIHADLSTSVDSLKEFCDRHGGRWRGLPFELLARFGCRYVDRWTSPKARATKKYATATPRILIPSSSGDFYLARFAGNLDDYDDQTRENLSKYVKMNAGSPQLFNRDALDADEPVFVTEGAVDAMSIEYVGFRAVALNGRGNGDLLVTEIAKKERKVSLILLLDSDKAGRDAAPQLYDDLIDVGCPCVVRFLFDDESKVDCNDILTEQGEDDLRGRLEKIFDGARAELDACRAELAEVAAKEKNLIADDVLDTLFDGGATDVDFARRFEKIFGAQVRWLSDDERWLVYERNEFGGGLWTRRSEKSSCLAPQCQSLADMLSEHATNQREEKIAQSFQSTRRWASTCAALKGSRRLILSLDDLEKADEENTALVCCLNGVVDLRTGKLLDCDPKPFLMTQTVNAVFGQCAKENLLFVENFFRQIMPDDQTRAGLLRWLGYCLTGETGEEKFMVWIGDGGNGKGALSRAVLKLWHSYGVGLAPRTLCKNSQPTDADKATTALNGIVGRRFAISQEMPMDGELNASLIKDLSGSDEVNLRLNYGEYRTLINRAKINISGNYTPRIENVADRGIRRRLLNMPFDVTFGPDGDYPADPTLKKKLLTQENLNALFSILVREAVAWYRDGLIISPLMTKARQKHLRDSDFVSDFLDEYYEFGADLSTKAKTVVDELKEKYPAECRPFRKRADLINLIAAVDGVEYAEDRKKFKIFKGIAKPKPKNQNNFGDGEILSSQDYPPFG